MTKMRIAVLASAVVGLTLFAGPGRAQDGPLIQPGAAVLLSGGALGKPCTLNFVFRDHRHTYIGASARCAATDGERATMADREFGTVVFRAMTIKSFEECLCPHEGPAHDFALIRVDASELHRVSPVILDVGRAPTGVTTADQTKEGDLMSMTGQGVLHRDGPTRHRRGALISDDDESFNLAIPASLGDSGAPVLDANLKAYGVLASGGSATPYGNTIERVLLLLDQAGFDVELVTA